MQQQKKLTLQQYIECYNIKKQLRQRSKQKSRSKSKDKTISLSNINDIHDNSGLSINQSKQKINSNSHHQLNKSIYDQVDFRAKNLYNQLHQTINQTKLQCRTIIKNDKDFAYFVKLMDALMNKFRLAVLHIHRQNLLLFQMSNQVDKSISNEKDQLTKTHIENLQKSFNQKYQLSKSQYESNLNFISNKTIKQKMQQNKKGENLVKAIFGGFGASPENHKKITPKVYLTEAKDQKQRLQRKQQAVNFLGFIMRNIAESKKTQQPQQNLKDEKKTDSFNIFDMLQKPKQQQRKQLSLPPTQKSAIKNHNQNKSQPHKLDQKMIVRNINYLNSSGKVNINTEDIDSYYDHHNVSFGVHGVDNQKPIKSNKESKEKVTNLPKKPLQRPPIEQKNTVPSEKAINSNQRKVSQNKNINIKSNRQLSKSPQLKNQPSNRQQLIQRTNTRSKTKLTNRISSTKKGN